MFGGNQRGKAHYLLKPKSMFNRQTTIAKIIRGEFWVGARFPRDWLDVLTSQKTS